MRTCDGENVLALFRTSLPFVSFAFEIMSDVQPWLVVVRCWSIMCSDSLSVPVFPVGLRWPNELAQWLTDKTQLADDELRWHVTEHMEPRKKSTSRLCDRSTMGRLCYQISGGRSRKRPHRQSPSSQELDEIWSISSLDMTQYLQWIRYSFQWSSRHIVCFVRFNRWLIAVAINRCKKKTEKQHGWLIHQQRARRRVYFLFESTWVCWCSCL